MGRLKAAVNRLAKRLDVIDPPPEPAYCHGCIDIVEVRQGEPSPPFLDPCPRCGLPRWTGSSFSPRNATPKVIRLEVVIPADAPPKVQPEPASEAPVFITDARRPGRVELEAAEPWERTD